MDSKQRLYTLQDIQQSLHIAISQVAVYNLYVDLHADDSHFSNCLISLQNSLEDIADRLYQYQKSTEINPSVAIAPSVNEEVSTDGN